MSTLVRSLVRRHMKQTSAGAVTLRETDDVVTRDEVLARYVNPPPFESSSILFTDRALVLVEGDRTETVLYDDIVDFRKDWKETVRADGGFWIRTVRGDRFITISGRHGPNGNLLDAASLVMILHMLAVVRERARP